MKLNRRQIFLYKILFKSKDIYHKIEKKIEQKISLKSDDNDETVYLDILHKSQENSENETWL